MKKRFTEEKIIGFLREAEASIPVKELCGGTASARPRTTCGAASSAAYALMPPASPIGSLCKKRHMFGSRVRKPCC